MTSARGRTAAAWNAEYTRGRYRDDPPVRFVREILAAARARGLRSGLEFGCGNGRNYLPLVRGGLDLLGVDLSPVAIEQLSARAPARAARLVCGDLSALPSRTRFEVVVAIQVLQHGTRASTHRAVRALQRRVAPGGLFCLRVNAVGTELEHAHRSLERASDGGYTVRYRAGPKAGLAVHFFARAELRALFADGFRTERPLRRVEHVRPPPGRGRWMQWEAIWRRNPTAWTGSSPEAQI